MMWLNPLKAKLIAIGMFVLSALGIIFQMKHLKKENKELEEEVDSLENQVEFKNKVDVLKRKEEKKVREEVKDIKEEVKKDDFQGVDVFTDPNDF